MTEVHCRDCGTLLPELPNLDPSRRRPCPICGSLGREYRTEMKGVIEVSGAGAFTLHTIREYYERHPLWLAVNAVVTVGLAITGLVWQGPVGGLVGAVLGLLAAVAIPNWQIKVIREETRPP